MPLGEGPDVGSRKHDAPRLPATFATWLTASLVVVVVILLFYPRVASDVALQSSARANAASFEVSAPIRSDVDQRDLAEPSVAGLGPVLDHRTWSASAPTECRKNQPGMRKR